MIKAWLTMLGEAYSYEYSFVSPHAKVCVQLVHARGERLGVQTLHTRDFTMENLTQKILLLLRNAIRTSTEYYHDTIRADSHAQLTADDFTQLFKSAKLHLWMNGFGDPFRADLAPTLAI
jgi:hypothetical protein